MAENNKGLYSSNFDDVSLVPKSSSPVVVNGLDTESRGPGIPQQELRVHQNGDMFVKTLPFEPNGPFMIYTRLNGHEESWLFEDEGRGFVRTPSDPDIFPFSPIAKSFREDGNKAAPQAAGPKAQPGTQ